MHTCMQIFMQSIFILYNYSLNKAMQLHVHNHIYSYCTDPQLPPKYYMRFIDAGSGFFEPSKRAMSCHSLLLAVGVAHA